MENAPPQPNNKKLKMALWVGAGLLVLSLIIWLIIKYSKKKPTTDNKPGSVSNIGIKSTGGGGGDSSSTTEMYENKDEYNPGIRINFTVPKSTGIKGDTTFKSYRIYLSNVVEQSTSISHISTDLVKDSVFMAGASSNVLQYDWNSTSNGLNTTSVGAELLIKSSVITALTDQSTYFIGIQAINNLNIGGDMVWSAAPGITYDACKGGNKAACGWGDGAEAGNRASKVVAVDALAIGSGTAASTTMQYAAPVDGGACKVAVPINNNTLYHYDTTLKCVPFDCMSSEYNFKGTTEGCVLAPKVGGACGTTGNVYYATSNTSILVCDSASKPVDSQVVSNLSSMCLSKPTGSGISSWTFNNARPLECTAVCTYPYLGPECKGTVPSGADSRAAMPAAVVWTAFIGSLLRADPYTFGPVEDRLGLYKTIYVSAGGTKLFPPINIKVWEEPSTAFTLTNDTTNGTSTLTIGGKVFTVRPPSSGNPLTGAELSRGPKTVRLDSTTGNLIIYANSGVSTALHNSYVNITPAMMLSAEKTQSLVVAPV